MNYCPACGQKLEESMKFCSNCGQKLVEIGKELVEKEKPVESKESRSSTLIIERAEPTYYSDNNGIRITPTRLIIPGKNKKEGPSTYTMANITSVKTEKVNPIRWGGIIVALIGIFLIIIGINSHSTSYFIISGVAILCIGLAWAILVKPTYHLKISSASGESDALWSKEKGYIERIVTAINEAIIKRG
jgi:hypothetical protein